VPGQDPSHPAFYIPAQELLAGNSRGYWVVDPCRANGETCDSGDQCCGGYCRKTSGELPSSFCADQQGTCALEYEKCAATADCCDAASGMRCIGGRCTRMGPN
jgi:hypothetical protein